MLFGNVGVVYGQVPTACIRICIDTFCPDGFPTKCKGGSGSGSPYKDCYDSCFGGGGACAIGCYKSDNSRIDPPGPAADFSYYISDASTCNRISDADLDQQACKTCIINTAFSLSVTGNACCGNDPYTNIAAPVVVVFK